MCVACALWRVGGYWGVTRLEGCELWGCWRGEGRRGRVWRVWGVCRGWGGGGGCGFGAKRLDSLYGWANACWRLRRWMEREESSL